MPVVADVGDSSARARVPALRVPVLKKKEREFEGDARLCMRVMRIDQEVGLF